MIIFIEIMSKTKFKNSIHTLSILCLMFFSNMLFAQKSGYDLIVKELTIEQKTLLQKEREIMKTNREALKATLSKEQISILKDKTISRSEIRSKLVATFSDIQKGLIKNQEVRLRNSRETFRKSLTEDQRKLLKDRIDKTRKSKDRGELKDRVRDRNNEDGRKQREPRGN